MREWIIISTFLLLSTSALPAVGQDLSSSAEASLVVSGTMSAAGDLQLRLEFGEIFEQGAKIYSEPSHTLLALVLGTDFARSPQGQALRNDSDITQRTAIVTTIMPGGAPSLGGLWPQASDDRIAVWALTGGGSELMADAKVNLREFAVEVMLVDPEADSGPEAELRNKIIRHCCSSPCGLEECKNCVGPRFTCCYCNDLECGDHDCNLVP